MQLVAETADVLRDYGNGPVSLMAGRGRSLTVRSGVQLHVARENDASRVPR